MANIKSQIKRNKTNEKARQRNKSVKSEVKTAVRHTREAVAGLCADWFLATLETAGKPA